jgi:hypothetical protein
VIPESNGTAPDVTAPVVTPAMRRTRLVLGALGIALLVLGAVVLLNDVSPTNYGGIVVWFVGALVIHDGIISFTVFGADVLMRRTGARLRIPLGVILIVQGALVLGAIMALIVVPEILKQDIGSANPTLLPLDYSLHLAVFYAVLAGVTVVGIAAYLLATRLLVARRRR